MPTRNQAASRGPGKQDDSQDTGAAMTTSMQPYYADDLVTLWLGDCREVTAWLDADVLAFG